MVAGLRVAPVAGVVVVTLVHLRTLEVLLLAQSALRVRSHSVQASSCWNK